MYPSLITRLAEPADQGLAALGLDSGPYEIRQRHGVGRSQISNACKKSLLTSDNNAFAWTAAHIK